MAMVQFSWPCYLQWVSDIVITRYGCEFCPPVVYAFLSAAFLPPLSSPRTISFWRCAILDFWLFRPV